MATTWTRGTESMYEYELEMEFQALLDEEIVFILGMEYSAGYVLKNVDPTAFRCAFFDWLDSEGWE